MKSKKGKKGATPPFKLVPKTDIEENQIKELNLKKKILVDKYIMMKNRAIEAVQKLEEKRNTYMNIMELKKYEVGKYDCIKTDFNHQTQLMMKNYKAKIEDLNAIKAKKNETIEQLKATLEKMKIDYETELDKKRQMLNKIKFHMEEMSQDFSNKLSEIQTNLKKQIENVSIKFEQNTSDHVKSFEAGVKQYDISK